MNQTGWIRIRIRIQGKRGEFGFGFGFKREGVDSDSRCPDAHITGSEFVFEPTCATCTVGSYTPPSTDFQ